MSKNQLISFFQSTGGVSSEQAGLFAQDFTAHRLDRGQLLLAANTVSDDYFFLDQGLLRAYAHNPDGAEITTAFYASGQVVFEVASFFTRIPALENIQALTECHGWRISYAQLNALFHAHVAFREFGRAVLVRGFAALKTRTLSMITEPAAVRYAHLLRTHPEIIQQAPLKDIATYLGITSTSLSRIRKAL